MSKTRHSLFSAGDRFRSKQTTARNQLRAMEAKKLNMMLQEQNPFVKDYKFKPNRDPVKLLKTKMNELRKLSRTSHKKENVTTGPEEKLDISKFAPQQPQ